MNPQLAHSAILQTAFAFWNFKVLLTAVELGDAFDFSEKGFRKWCGEVGFKLFEVTHLAGASSAVVAYK